MLTLLAIPRQQSKHQWENVWRRRVQPLTSPQRRWLDTMLLFMPQLSAPTTEIENHLIKMVEGKYDTPFALMPKADRMSLCTALRHFWHLRRERISVVFQSGCDLGINKQVVFVLASPLSTKTWEYQQDGAAPPIVTPWPVDYVDGYWYAPCCICHDPRDANEQPVVSSAGVWHCPQGGRARSPAVYIYNIPTCSASSTQQHLPEDVEMWWRSLSSLDPKLPVATLQGRLLRIGMLVEAMKYWFTRNPGVVKV